MKTNILEYLTEAAGRLPEKRAYFDEEIGYTYAHMLNEVKAIGTKLIKKLNVRCRPVLIYMEKSPAVLAAFGARWPAGTSMCRWTRICLI